MTASDVLFRIMLGIHIFAGALSLLCGPVAMTASKGMRLHRLAGKVFHGSMTATALAAFYLSVVHPNPFLFVISGFSLYMVLSGVRLARMRVSHDSSVSAVDFLLTGGMALFGIGMLMYGVVLFMSGATTGLVLAVFGTVSLFFVVQDIRFHRMKERKGSVRIQLHIGRMVGATIAAYTAFLVVNDFGLPQLISWLGPTALGVPFIVYFTATYAGKSKKQKAEAIA